ncbi:MAG: FAD-dependent oxidoreductase [Candidatus Eisenbacteria bacterium]|nr:FAD-dependent oxidoreductase [Candidatus Eisenbacteria bacterium]
MTERTERSRELTETARTYSPHEAVLEASRCLMCDDPPCNSGCPAGVDVRRFVRKIRFSNFRGAARIIRDANLMVGICGRVCPQEILCMEKCTRGELDTPIDIAGLQRFAGDVELGTLAPLPDLPSRRREKVAVIGAGPAGLGAASELLKRGFGVEIFERTDAIGGVLAHGVPPFRLDRGFLASELDYVKRMGAKLHCGSDEADPASLLERGFSAVVVGVGLSRPYRIGLPGEDLAGVHIAADFLEASAKGESPPIGARVVVIGGGNVAVDAAMTCLRLGADKVDLCSLESYDELPAFRSETETAQREGVEFHTRTRPVRISGQSGRVCGYEGIGIRWKEPGLLVPSNAEDVPGTEFSIPATAVIEAIGQGVRDGYPGVDADDRGLVRVHPETMATSMPGVFAAGDVVSGGATAVRAFAEGKRAAEGMAAYIDSGRQQTDPAGGTKGGGRR